MRILLVNSLYFPNQIGGAENTVRNLAEAWAVRGNHVAVVSLSTDGQARTAEVSGVRCYYVPLANVVWPWGTGRPRTWRRIIWHVLEAYNPVMGRRVARIINDFRPDVIHCHNLKGFSAAVWVAAKRRKVPVVQTLHDYYVACPGAAMYARGHNCERLCTSCRLFSLPRRTLSRLPTAITSVSRRTLARLEAGGAFVTSQPKHIIFGNNPDEPKSEARDDIGDRRPLRLGFIGRIEPIKGLEILIQALAGLPPGLASLAVAGTCTPEQRLALLRQAGSADVAFLGFVAPRDFFPAIDLLVVPSLWEDPFPRVIHEAMAYGVPTIASAIGGMPEIVEDGRTGYLVPPGDPAALAALLERLANGGMPARFLSEQCLERSQKFESAVIFELYDTVLRRAAGESGSEAAVLV